jgi:hypothetical protein
VKILGKVEIVCVGFYVVLVLEMKTGLTSTTSKGSSGDVSTLHMKP